MLHVRKRTATNILAAGLVFGSLFFVAACSPNGAPPAPKPSPSLSASAGASGPELVPDGTAKENLPYFDAVNQELLVANAKPDGRTFIDSLVAAGFTKGDMEVTPDKTAIGLDRDNIQFSVKFDDECLIGQFGNVGYHSTIVSVTQTNTCLIGTSRTIDW